ncbi:hypothetical protein GCM10010442_33670 [Kitasatospora kifunensis]
MTVPGTADSVTDAHEELPNHEPKSVVLPSPVSVVVGNVTVVPVQPPVTLQDTVIVYVSVVPLVTVADDGLTLTLAVPAALAGAAARPTAASDSAGTIDHARDEDANRPRGRAEEARPSPCALPPRLRGRIHRPCMSITLLVDRRQRDDQESRASRPNSWYAPGWPGVPAATHASCAAPHRPRPVSPSVATWQGEPLVAERAVNACGPTADQLAWGSRVVTGP